MKELEIIKFLKSYPYDWYEILTQPPYCLDIKMGENGVGGLVLFKYRQTESDFSLPIVQECRGLILDYLNNWSVVRLSFTKFFNAGEPGAAEIDWSTARVQDKIDGALMSLCFLPEDKAWLLSTNGTINAFRTPITSLGDSFITQADGSLTFGSVFQSIITKKMPWGDFLSSLNPDHIYTFELVSPQNKVVINYKPDIYHTATRDRNTLEELDEDIGIQKPNEYPLHSLDEVIKAAEALNSDKEITKEGFVVVDANWNRVKVKSPWYVAAAHMVVAKLSFGKTLDIYLAGEKNEFLAYFPEKKDTFDELEKFIGALTLHMAAGYALLMHEVGENPDRKTYALAAKKKAWSSYYLALLKHPSLTPKEFLFGGHFYEDEHGNLKETLPLLGLKDKLKKLYFKWRDGKPWEY